MLRKILLSENWGQGYCRSGLGRLFLGQKILLQVLTSTSCLFYYLGGHPKITWWFTGGPWLMSSPVLFWVVFEEEWAFSRVSTFLCHYLSHSESLMGVSIWVSSDNWERAKSKPWERLILQVWNAAMCLRLLSLLSQVTDCPHDKDTRLLTLTFFISVQVHRSGTSFFMRANSGNNNYVYDCIVPLWIYKVSDQSRGYF